MFKESKDFNANAANNPTPNMVVIDNNHNSCYNYVIHKPTNVVYLQYSKGGDQFGLTVMLNPDGTPITADQLEEFTANPLEKFVKE